MKSKIKPESRPSSIAEEKNAGRGGIKEKPERKGQHEERREREQGEGKDMDGSVKRSLEKKENRNELKERY